MFSKIKQELHKKLKGTDTTYLDILILLLNLLHVEGLYVILIYVSNIKLPGKMEREVYREALYNHKCYSRLVEINFVMRPSLVEADHIRIRGMVRCK